MESLDSSPVGTFVQLGQASGSLLGRRASSGQMPPATAAVLKAVLLAAAEQVSAEKLAAFQVRTALDLPLLSLAMAFRPDDNGLVGDVFEWSVLLAVNSGESEVTQMIVDALTMSGLKVERPRAVLVAAEPGRLIQYSPELPNSATLATGRRGRPPRIDRLLEGATTRTWKADLLLGEGDRWVSASLKSNPHAVVASLTNVDGGNHSPRIGVTAVASTSAGVVRDPQSGGVIVKVPVDGTYYTLARVVLAEVRDAFARHLSVPGTPLQQGAMGVSGQLWNWRARTLAEIISTLDEIAGTLDIPVTEPHESGTSADHATSSLIAVDTLSRGGRRTPFVTPGATLNSKRDFNFEPIP